MYTLYATTLNRADREIIDLSFDRAMLTADIMKSDKNVIKIDLIKRNRRVATIYDTMNPQLDA